METMTAWVSVPPASRTTGTVNGTAVDRAEHGGAAEVGVLLVCGAIDGTHTVVVQDSDNGTSGWAAVDPAQIQGTVPSITSADANTVVEFGVAISRRYMRINLTASGAITGGTIGAVIVLGELRFSIDRS